MRHFGHFRPPCNVNKSRKNAYLLFMLPLEPHKAHTCMHHTCHLRLARVTFSNFEKRPKAFYIKQSIFGAPNDRRMNRVGSFFSSDRFFVRASKSRGFVASSCLGGNREAKAAQKKSSVIPLCYNSIDGYKIDTAKLIPSSGC